MAIMLGKFGAIGCFMPRPGGKITTGISGLTGDPGGNFVCGGGVPGMKGGFTVIGGRVPTGGFITSMGGLTPIGGLMMSGHRGHLKGSLGNLKPFALAEPFES
jgi:hypothetical protein